MNSSRRQHTLSDGWTWGKLYLSDGSEAVEDIRCLDSAIQVAMDSSSESESDAQGWVLPGELVVKGGRRFSAITSIVTLRDDALRARPSDGLLPAFAEQWLTLSAPQPSRVTAGAILQLPHPIDAELQRAYVPWLAALADHMTMLRGLGSRIDDLAGRLPSDYRLGRVPRFTTKLSALQKSLTSMAFEP